MKHLELLLKNGYSFSGDHAKSPVNLVTGRFYTPELIGRELATSTANIISKTDRISCIDPFCGDGRLIVWLLEASAKRSNQPARWDIELWDCDASACAMAKTNVSAAARRLGIKVRITAKVVDSFSYGKDHASCFDVVITNPPWDALKPDTRYLKQLDPSERSEYVQRLRTQIETLNTNYPLSNSTKHFSGWGLNLSRCGIELALRLFAPTGTACSMVVPATFFADQVSSGLRKNLLLNYEIPEIGYYPAETHLFEKVDQPTATIVATNAPRTRFAPIIKRLGVTGLNTERISLDLKWFEINNFIVPLQFQAKHLQLLLALASFPRFSTIEGIGVDKLWAGRELDETGIGQYLGKTGEHAFAKGRLVARFDKVLPTHFLKSNTLPIPASVQFHRIVWRDVSRTSQKRRMITTLIPPGIVTGNSLGVAYFKDDNLPRLRGLLGVVSSLVFEFQVRAFLGTGHVSLNAIRSSRIVALDNSHFLNIGRHVEKALSGSASAELNVEQSTAKAFGLSREQFSCIVDAFPKLSDIEKQDLTDLHRWRSA